MPAGSALAPTPSARADPGPREAGEGKQRQRECEWARERARDGRQRDALGADGRYARKLHSFWPTNDSGVAATIEIAWATTFASPAPSTSDTSTT